MVFHVFWLMNPPKLSFGQNMDFWNSVVGSLVLEVPPPQTPDFWHRYLKSASQCFIRMSFAAARWSWKEDSDFECVGGWILDGKKCFQKENWWFVGNFCIRLNRYTCLHILVFDRIQRTEPLHFRKFGQIKPRLDKTSPNFRFSSSVFRKFGTSEVR